MLIFFIKEQKTTALEFLENVQLLLPFGNFSCSQRDP